MNSEIMQLKKNFGKISASEVFGVGIDIEEVDRFRSRDVSGNPELYAKIFTKKEIAYCTTKADPYPHFTARFAAKEAVVKAIGMTMFKLNDIEIMNEPSGRPRVMIRSHPEYMIEISLSHTKSHGAAIALWLR